MYNQQQGNYSKTTRGQTDSSLNRINKVFAMIRLTYPTFLKNEAETETKRLWFSHLESFSEDKIDAALKMMPDEFPKFPPTIGEFKKLIREQLTETNIRHGLAICSTCRSTKVSRRHQDMCIEKTIEPERFRRVDPDEIRAQLKEFLNGR
jgi:hypothetical protein